MQPEIQISWGFSNNAPRNIDLLHMVYARQSIIGSGGYMPEDVWDV